MGSHGILSQYKSNNSNKNNKRRPAMAQILVAIIVLTVVFYLFLVRTYSPGWLKLTWAQDNPNAPSSPSPISDVTEVNENESGWGRVKELQEDLEKKKKELDEKSLSLEQKEQRLTLIKQEIIQEIETLQTLKKQIEQALTKVDEEQEKRIRELSKIFEGAPPEQAGVILSSTDVPTAAEIIIRMEKRKAGKLWGYVEPELAAQISKFIMGKNSLKNRQAENLNSKDEQAEDQSAKP